MALIVQKYGGTSLSLLACIEHVANKIIAIKQQGNQVAVVVSAMSGDTDRLITLAKAIQDQPDPREYDVLLSTGEQVSMSLLCMALIKRGFRARSYIGRQAKIMTCGHHGNARICKIICDGLWNDLNQDSIAVVAGFQGIDERDNVNTLGRGGSDTTAVALAAALKADECQIYTDVEGVYTADPRIIPHARRLNKITFTVSRDDYQQTLVLLHEVMGDIGAVGVIGDEKICKLSLIGMGMRSHTGIASRMFETLGKEGINIQIISTSEIKLSVVIDEKYLELGIRSLHDAFSLGVEAQEECDLL